MNPDTQPPVKSEDELQEKCRRMQVLMQMDDVDFKKVYGYEGGLYGLITQEAERHADQRELSVRKNLALDHYRGKTFSDSTNYRAKFDRFINSNESRIVELKAKQQEGK